MWCLDCADQRGQSLSPEAKRLLVGTKEALLELRRQFRDLVIAEKKANELICWLECPWDYGDIVEERALTWKPRTRPRVTRRFVVVGTRLHGYEVDGRLIKSDGTLGKDTRHINHDHRLVGRYTGDDLPDPPEAAVLAMKAKGGVALGEE